MNNPTLKNSFETIDATGGWMLRRFPESDTQREKTAIFSPKMVVLMKLQAQKQTRYMVENRLLSLPPQFNKQLTCLNRFRMSENSWRSLKADKIIFGNNLQNNFAKSNIGEESFPYRTKGTQNLSLRAVHSNNLLKLFFFIWTTTTNPIAIEHRRLLKNQHLSIERSPEQLSTTSHNMAFSL